MTVDQNDVATCAGTHQIVLQASLSGQSAILTVDQGLGSPPAYGRTYQVAFPAFS